MKKIALVFCFIVTASIAKAAPYSLINMGPDLKVYVNQYRNSSVDEQWKGWKAFESKYAAYFESGLCDASDEKCEAKKKTRLEMFFLELPTFEAKMWDLFDRSEEISSLQVSKFKKFFPDLQDDTPIVFMPSLLSFNGRGVHVGNKSVLLIGVDFTASKSYDLNVLFSHEFFHVYQFAKIPADKIFLTLYSPLWLEGFATWMSIYLNPQVSDSVALMNEELGNYCAQQENIKILATEFMTVMSKVTDDSEGDSLYGEWFSNSGKTGPHRRGYCLGLHVMREVTKQKSITQIVTLDEAGFKPLVEAALKTLAK